jgi:hypothetical protein
MTFIEACQYEIQKHHPIDYHILLSFLLGLPSFILHIASHKRCQHIATKDRCRRLPGAATKMELHGVVHSEDVLIRNDSCSRHSSRWRRQGTSTPWPQLRLPSTPQKPETPRAQHGMPTPPHLRMPRLAPRRLPRLPRPRLPAQLQKPPMPPQLTVPRVRLLRLPWLPLSRLPPLRLPSRRLPQLCRILPATYCRPHIATTHLPGVGAGSTANTISASLSGYGPKNATARRIAA